MEEKNNYPSNRLKFLQNNITLNFKEVFKMFIHRRQKLVKLCQRQFPFQYKDTEYKNK